MPLFLVFATFDRLAFFVVWTLLQAMALRRFVAEVPVRSVFAIRGGSELLRTVSNPLSDGAFFLGLGQLAGGRYDAVIAAAVVPTFCHFLVMLAQMTLALPLLSGGISGNRDVALTAGIIWLLLIGFGVAIRMSATRQINLPGVARMRAWFQQFPLRELRPFLLGFVALTIFDVIIQGLASRAFGVEISWIALTARIPLLYLALIVPTLGNFGTREVAWAALFAEYGARDQLIAYALAINAVFLVLNLILGLVFLTQALRLLSAVREARREGESLPGGILHDPTDL